MASPCVAVFFTGSESVDASLCFAGAGAAVVLLGQDRDHLDVGGRQIIQSMDALVKEGSLDPQGRFTIYSRLQKKVLGELPAEVGLYLDAATDAAELPRVESFLASRSQGVVLSLRQPGGPPPAVGGDHTRVLLACDEPFLTTRQVKVSLLHTPAGVSGESVVALVQSLLQSMDKVAVVA